MRANTNCFLCRISTCFPHVRALLLAAAVCGSSAVLAAEDDEKVVDPSAPVIVHAPVTTAARGIPVQITASVTPQGGASVTSKTVLVKVSDIGTPVSYPLAGAEDGGAYNATIPVSIIKGVNVFWYSINIVDSSGRINGTPWLRVVIIDPVETGGGSGEGSVGVTGGSGGGTEPAAGGGKLRGAPGPAGGSGGIGKTTLIVGGVLLAGGAAAIIENQNNGCGGSEPERNLKLPKRPKENESSSKPEDPPCTVTGSESTMYENLSFYCEEPGGPIMILVCGTCPDATISATASWGESDLIAMYNNPACSQTASKLQLNQPVLIQGAAGTNFRRARANNGGTGGGFQGFIEPGTETITVFSNGIQIDQIVWPPLSDQDCL